MREVAGENANAELVADGEGAGARACSRSRAGSAPTPSRVRSLSSKRQPGADEFVDLDAARRTSPAEKTAQAATRSSRAAP